jgi:hypothetical protein
MAIDRDVLVAFYDLAVQPVTYDFAWFLCLADLERVEKGLTRLVVLFVPGGCAGVREEAEDYDRAVGLAERRARVQRMLVPMTELIPRCEAILLDQRESALVVAARAGGLYPRRYDPAFPLVHNSADLNNAARGQEVRRLVAPTSALESVEAWITEYCSGARIVTITLRECAFEPGRNSDIQAWAKLSVELEALGYQPVFVRDTEKVGTSSPLPIAEAIFHDGASRRVDLRMALYARAEFNLSVNNGPAALQWLGAGVRYATFKMHTPVAAGTAYGAMRSRGFAEGSDLHFAGLCERWIWEPDRIEVLRPVVAAMIAAVESEARPCNMQNASNRASSD